MGESVCILMCIQIATSSSGDEADEFDHRQLCGAAKRRTENLVLRHAKSSQRDREVCGMIGNIVACRMIYT